MKDTEGSVFGCAVILGVSTSMCIACVSVLRIVLLIAEAVK